MAASQLYSKDVMVSITEAPKSSYSTIETEEKQVSPDGHHQVTYGRPVSPAPAASLRRRNTRVWTDESTNDEDLTQLGMTWQRMRSNVLIRYITYIVPVAILLAIPIVLCATVYKDARITSTFKTKSLFPISEANISSIHDSTASNITTYIYNSTSEQVLQEQTTVTTGGIRLLGLFIWIEVVWVLLWIAKLMAQSVPIAFQTVAGAIHTGIRKYSLILKAVEIPLSLFFWAILTLASRAIIWTFDQQFHMTNAGEIHWLSVLHSVNKATIGVAALYLIEKILIQMVSVNYHGKKQYDTVKELETLSRAIETMYDVSRGRFQDNHPAFKEVDLDIFDVRGYRKDENGRRTRTNETAAHFLTNLGTTGSKITTVFGYMASDIAGKQVLMPTSSGPIVEAALERPIGAEALARRIWNSFTNFGTTTLDLEAMEAMFGPGGEAQALYIHRKMDADENGDLTLEEMIDLVKKVAADRKTIWAGACNIKDAIKVLDRVLSVAVLIVIGLIYAAFFSDYLAKNYTQVWSAFTGCSFLFASTAGELFAACITVFIKHPYDVGDRISINDSEMDVIKISLLYSVFKDVHSRQLVQIPNSTINGLWIKNVTRSRELKEHITLDVCADTTFTDLEVLREQLALFAAEHKRDFLPDVGLQLTSVSDLKSLQIRVEYEHKGNAASQQTRANRRSIFMCGVLSAMRAVPIAPPGGNGAGPGSKELPNYTVAISDETSRAAREAFEERRDGKRLFPKNRMSDGGTVEGDAAASVPVGGAPVGSSSLEVLPSLLRQTRPRASEEERAYR